MVASPKPATLAAGALIGERYRVISLLGTGGMANVYLAENTAIGRKVAIKILHSGFALDEELLARFRQEARASAAIGHPGIVDVIDLGAMADGAPYIVMESLVGETLGQRLDREQLLPIGEVWRIFVLVLDAISAAHSAGVIHRDLKPDNIFLVDRPTSGVKVLDFGISKLAATGEESLRLTTTGVVLGTPLFMSPEQARGARTIGAATDVYALGAILYQCLAGVPPFVGRSYNEVIAQVLIEEPPDLKQLRADAPAELIELVSEMMRKKPEERIDVTSISRRIAKHAEEAQHNVPSGRMAAAAVAMSHSGRIAAADLVRAHPRSSSSNAPKLPSEVVDTSLSSRGEVDSTNHGSRSATKSSRRWLLAGFAGAAAAVGALWLFKSTRETPRSEVVGAIAPVEAPGVNTSAVDKTAAPRGALQPVATAQKEPDGDPDGGVALIAPHGDPAAVAVTAFPPSGSKTRGKKSSGKQPGTRESGSGASSSFVKPATTNTAATQPVGAGLTIDPNNPLND